MNFKPILSHRLIAISGLNYIRISRVLIVTFTLLPKSTAWLTATFSAIYSGPNNNIRIDKIDGYIRETDKGHKEKNRTEVEEAEETEDIGR